MPEGVEHIDMAIKTWIGDDVKPSSMPEGVEHSPSQHKKLDLSPGESLRGTGDREVERPVVTKSRREAFKLFQQGCSIEEVARSVRRAESTTLQYLIEYIGRNRLTVPQPWVDNEMYGRVKDMVDRTCQWRPKVVFDQLEGTVSYQAVRIAMACLRNVAAEGQSAGDAH